MLLDYKRIAPRLRTESALLPVRYESNERLLESIDDPMRFLKDAEGDLMLMMLQEPLDEDAVCLHQLLEDRGHTYE